MANDDRSWRKLKTVDTAMEIIETLAAVDSAGVTELATQLDLSKSSTYSYLTTLQEADYLTREGNEYRLSYQFLLLGEYVRNSNPLFQFGRPKAAHLATETGHYAHLYAEEDGRGINIYESRGEHAGDYDYQSLKLQQREPLHVTASGKAILAHLSTDRVSEIIRAQGLEQWTANTITDEDALFAELEEIEEQGFAVNDEEEIEGFRAVAAPVCVSGGDILGSISVSGPTTFFSEGQLRETVAEQVTSAANMIEVDVNMSEREL
ncbi:IclR family transcriptional regulator [Natrialbaceae archaeon A-arb3/5]